MIIVKEKNKKTLLFGAHLECGKYYIIKNGQLDGKLIYTSWYCQGPIIINLVEPYPTQLNITPWFYNNGSFVEFEKMRFIPVDVEIAYQIQENPE